jgi:GH24 family phage-related lysozyme (muramidase)
MTLIPFEFTSPSPKEDASPEEPGSKALLTSREVPNLEQHAEQARQYASANEIVRTTEAAPYSQEVMDYFADRYGSVSTPAATPKPVARSTGLCGTRPEAKAAPPLSAPVSVPLTRAPVRPTTKQIEDSDSKEVWSDEAHFDKFMSRAEEAGVALSNGFEQARQDFTSHVQDPPPPLLRFTPEGSGFEFGSELGGIDVAIDPGELEHGVDPVDGGFMDYMRDVEGAVRDPKTGNYKSYPSMEGGLNTVGIGHKLQKGETFGDMTEEEAEALFRVDLNKHAAKARKTFNGKYGDAAFESLPIKHQQALIDLQFGVAGGVAKYPKFMKAVATGDREGMLREYTRSYGPAGRKVLDERRNRKFYEEFLAEGPN